MRFSNSRLTLFILIITLFAACKKDGPSNQSNNAGDNDTSGTKLWIANEGAYGNGNASLSYINFNNDSIYNNVYANNNSNETLGDILESITINNNSIYLIVNNSNKIIVANKQTLKKTATIAISQPRYMVVYGQKAFVSSLYNKKIFVIDLNSNTITDSILFAKSNIEGIKLVGNTLYACPWDTSANYIYTIDADNNTVTDSITIANKAPQSLAIDKNGYLWVSSGNGYSSDGAGLTVINPQNKSIVKSFSIQDNNVTISNPVFNPNKDSLYFISINYAGSITNNGIYKMGIDQTNLPTSPWLAAAQNQYYWGLAVHPTLGTVYVTDPKGFIQQGSLMKLNPDGTLIKQWLTGIGPGFMTFDL